MDIYEHRELKPGFWMIGERMSGEPFSLGGALEIYLVEGENRAALIDSGMGITHDLRKVCESLTDKPITCYVTHGHPDHAGGACLFDEVYMAPQDEVDFRWALPARRRWNDLVRGSQGRQALLEYCWDNMIQDASFSYRPLRDGDRIDLGGKVLEVISVPGHTPGSMCFYNRAEKYVCVGDAISCNQMFGASSTTVKVYKESLERFLTLVEDDVELYTGHRGEALATDAPREMILTCQEVLRGKTAEDVPAEPRFVDQIEEYKTKRMMDHVRGRCRLTYDADHIA